MHLQLAYGSVVVAASVVSAFLALHVFSMGLSNRRFSPSLAALPLSDQSTVFLFEERSLVDATPRAQALLDTAPRVGSDWDRLSSLLSPHFSDFDARMAELAGRGQLELEPAGHTRLRLIAETLGRTARIRIEDQSATSDAGAPSAISNRAQEDELTDLRETTSTVPVLAWRLDLTGRICWANRAYLAACAAHLGISERDLVWPLPTLIPPQTDQAQESGRRVQVASAAAQKPNWFEYRCYPSVRGSVHFAIPSDSAVRAETALREFIQTLTKTFAHLPIGLAIFDRQRQLALFNPALVDLTQLGAEFLSGRPTLFAFLDRLREARMIPEPKDYPTWRNTMADLEKRAATDLYEDTWTLPTGQTYRVIGRPHPDGAVAFLLEDISAETTLVRRFRADIELGQAVIDAVDEAIAVFSPAGILVLSNLAYGQLWGSDPGSTLGEIGIEQALRTWQMQTGTHAIWPEVHDFVTEIGIATGRGGIAEMPDGRRLACRLQRLTGGMSLVGFRIMAAGQPPGRTGKPLWTGENLAADQAAI